MNEWKLDFDEMVRLFPEIKELENIEQNPKYHGEGNVFIHTQRVCEALKGLDEWGGLNEQEQLILYMAGLFHDLGKKVCTKIVDGELASPKHAVIGAKMFRELLYKKYGERYEIGFHTRESIAQLIRYHGLPLFFIEKKHMDYEMIRASECVDMKLLYLLAKADLLGRICKDQGVLLEQVMYFKEYAIELGCYEEKMRFVNSYTRFLYLNYNSIWYGDEVFDNRQFKVIMMVGIPLAGKDSYIEKNFEDLPVISLDDIRKELKIEPKDGSKKVVTIAKERAKELLRKKQSFIWNATNIMKDTREKLCRLFSDYGAVVEYIYLEVPYSEILKRYKKRERIVPIEVINHMIKKMDMIEAWEGEKITKVVQFKSDSL